LCTSYWTFDSRFQRRLATIILISHTITPVTMRKMRKAVKPPIKLFI
jgi:hypothetical protein